MPREGKRVAEGVRKRAGTVRLIAKGGGGQCVRRSPGTWPAQGSSAPSGARAGTRMSALSATASRRRPSLARALQGSRRGPPRGRHDHDRLGDGKEPKGDPVTVVVFSKGANGEGRQRTAAANTDTVLAGPRSRSPGVPCRSARPPLPSAAV